MTKTSIEWTDETWNPVTGCDKVSPGCDNCYAEGIANRFAGTPQFPNGFGVTLRPERLGQPLKWRKPRRVFVNSMSDLFHDDIPDNFIGSVFDTMALAEQHTFQILTKRPGRARSLLRRWQEAAAGSPHAGASFRRHDMHWSEPPVWPLPNVWLGVSAENQKWANIRIPVLLETPAAVRFISAEPLLGPIKLRADWLPSEDLDTGDRGGIDWVIAGGESGPKARPMHPDWARSLRDQCADAGTAFLFKQWGEWGPAPWKLGRLSCEADAEYKARSEAEAATHSFAPWAHEYDMAPQKAHPAWGLERGAPDCEPHAALRRWGKKSAGRELDGRTWDEFPGTAAEVS